MILKMTKLTSTFLALGVFVAISSTQAFAYRGDPSVQGPNYSKERHEKMLKIMDTTVDANTLKLNYAEWKKLMANKPVLQKVDTLEEFKAFLEMRKLKLQGKDTEAAKLREKLGLSQGKGQGRGCNRN